MLVRGPSTRRRKEAGLPPGTVEFAGERRAEKVRVSVLSYDAEGIEEKDLEAATDSYPYFDSGRTVWVNVSGLHEPSVLRAFGDKPGLHPLVLEDILHTRQRPKLEHYPDHLFIVLRMIGYDEENRRVSNEQVSLVLGANYVLSFQEMEGDVFDRIRERIRQGSGRIRKAGADYLAYALLDAVVDHYFVALEKLGDDIEELEDELTEHPTPNTLTVIHTLKREMIDVRKSVFPVREVVAGLMRAESTLVRKGTEIFLRDVYDHTIQVIDSLESYRDILSGLQDLYLSSIGNKMNEVMKVLTIAATIFVPLTFLAGVYGMNFEHMPELSWKWSYPLFWTAAVLLALGMLFFFRRKKWL
ncbi:MAG: magnesium/cobalt transporter CorA [Candidatus Eisenbacteria bacterium]|nr:magnesium/cobalt transporter CorA [Candidatus Eisenbacteria bacterium]